MYSVITKRFVAFVKKLREETGITYTTLAGQIGVTQQYLSNVMNGKGVSDNTVEKLIESYPDARSFIFGVDQFERDQSGVFMINYVIHETQTRYPYRLPSGNPDDYLAYQINDDFLENNTELSIRDHDIVIGRNIPKEAWKNIFVGKFYIIHHKALGYICRYLISVERGFMTVKTTSELYLNQQKIDTTAVKSLFVVQELHTKRFKTEKLVEI